MGSLHAIIVHFQFQHERHGPFVQLSICLEDPIIAKKWVARILQTDRLHVIEPW